VLCSASGVSATRFGPEFGFEVATTDENEVINHPDVNAVFILTRHHHHARQLIAALKSGKHVFCEKPLCLSEDELRTIVKTYATQCQSILTVGYNRRFDPMVQRLKAFLADIHEPLIMHYRVNGGYIPPDHWVHSAEGGGRIIGEVCHFVDLLSFLADSLPIRVSARALPGDERYRDDNVVVTLGFANGSLGTITYVANGDRRFSKERVELFGGGAVAVLDDFRRLELVRHVRKQVVKLRLRQDKGHRGEVAAFVAAVQGGGPWPIPWRDMVAVSLTTFAIHEALRRGETVEIDTDGFIAGSREQDSREQGAR
jgi:predicted dehydrogenase